MITEVTVTPSTLHTDDSVIPSVEIETSCRLTPLTYPESIDFATALLQAIRDSLDHANTRANQ